MLINVECWHKSDCCWLEANLATLTCWGYYQILNIGVSVESECWLLCSGMIFFYYCVWYDKFVMSCRSVSFLLCCFTVEGGNVSAAMFVKYIPFAHKCVDLSTTCNCLYCALGPLFVLGMPALPKVI